MFLWNRLAGFLPTGVLQDVTSNRGFNSGHRSTVRRERRWSDFQLEKKIFPRGQRVLDGLSGARADTKEWLEMSSRVTDTVSCEMRSSNAEMIP
jgi:hypothetical protein